MSHTDKYPAYATWKINNGWITFSETKSTIPIVMQISNIEAILLHSDNVVEFECVSGTNYHKIPVEDVTVLLNDIYRWPQ